MKKLIYLILISFCLFSPLQSQDVILPFSKILSWLDADSIHCRVFYADSIIAGVVITNYSYLSADSIITASFTVWDTTTGFKFVDFQGVQRKAFIDSLGVRELTVTDSAYIDTLTTAILRVIGKITATDTVLSYKGVKANVTTTDIVDGEKYGIESIYTWTPSGDLISGSSYRGAGYFSSNVPVGNSKDLNWMTGTDIYSNFYGSGDIAGLEGVYGQTANLSSGAIGFIAGLDFTSSSSAGAVTKQAGIQSASLVTGGLTTDLYGIYSEAFVDAPAHATNRYGLYLTNTGTVTALDYGAYIDLPSSGVGLAIRGKKTASNLFEFSNDKNGTVGDSSIVGTPTGGITATGTSTFGATATPVVITSSGYIGLNTSTPQAYLSHAAAAPYWYLTDSDLNKNRTSLAQAIDTASVSFSTQSDGDAGIYIRGKDGTNVDLYSNDSYGYLDIQAAGVLYIRRGTSNVFSFGGSNVSYKNLTPGTDDTYYLGSSGTRWQYNYVSKGFYLGGKGLAPVHIVTTSSDYTAADSSLKSYILAGNGRYVAKATDADSVWLTVTADSARLGSNNPLLINSTKTLAAGLLGNRNQQTTTLGVGATIFAVVKNIATITGDGAGNTIGTITGAVPGIYVFIFVDALITITDTDVAAANTIDLAGTATNLTSADDLTLTLVFDGTSWFEMARSAN